MHWPSGVLSDANVPALPTRRSAAHRHQTPCGTPQLSARHQTFIQQQRQRPQLPTSSSSSTSSRGLNLTHLDERVDASSPSSRPLNDYRDFPTTTATRPDHDRHPVSRPTLFETTGSPAPAPRGVGLSGADDERAKKEKKENEKETTLPTSKSSSPSSECRESIICQRCGRCRCDECATRHTTPARRVVEICSCVTCLRLVVRRRRHGDRPTDDDEDADEEDDPCSCGPRRSDCRRRWVLLVLLSVCLPCLCLYWPLRCVVGACWRCAGGPPARRGCRCVERRRRDSELTLHGGRTSTSLAMPTRSSSVVIVDRVTTT